MAIKTGAVLARGRRFPDASIHVMSKTCEGYALFIMHSDLQYMHPESTDICNSVDFKR